MKPTQHRLSQLFSYDKDTGVLVRKITVAHNAKAGSVAGCLNSDGYLHLRVDITLYKAHQVIWALVYGSWPEGVIDHINRIKTDNRIENLRDTTVQVNNINKGVRKDSKTGHPNVTWRDRDRLFYVAVKRNGRQNYVGSFKDLSSAVRASETFKSEIGRLK